MPTLMQAIKRLRDRGILPRSDTVSVRDLNQRFQPVPSGSMRSLLLKMNTLADVAKPVGGSTHPYYRRSMPAPQKVGDFASDTTHIDLTNAHMPAYPSEPVELSAFNSLFDARAAAAVSDATGFSRRVRIFPSDSLDNPEEVLLEFKFYGDEAPKIYIPTAKCLAAMAYPDYFPEANADYLRCMVSAAILVARPGWCGTFGPGVEPTDLLGHFETGDYDMSQMHLLPIAYRYYDELFPEAREHLITQLLGAGRIHRVGLDDTLTHGGMPNDWNRAGIIDELTLNIRIGETENHILTILTARYLTNQLLYQRDHDPVHDNRRNSAAQHGPDCTGLLLTLLRDILRDDFSEYNAKPYQTQTRSALLNLCSYAYDHEVRLAARMVLDYISAHIAVSSSDLRRMVPFRRRNEEEHSRNAQLTGGVMNVGLLEWFLGADPMTEHFAIQAGNTRAYEHKRPPRPPPDDARRWDWAISSGGDDATMEALSDYRLPPSIHDLFVNDLHRRFFQRLHRVVQPNVELTGRNCDNMEIYAGSPSYLITAGGSPATWAIFPSLAVLTAAGAEENAKQLGVAVPTSFMPTGRIANSDIRGAGDLIQFSSFSSTTGEVANYGVAPDFACGHQVYLPWWVLAKKQSEGRFIFVDQGSSVPGKIEPAGFYLAIYSNEWSLNANLNSNFALLEAFDTWFHPGVTFQKFKAGVMASNPNLSNPEWSIQNNVEFQYTTQNGNRLRVVIWKGAERDGALYGAKLLGIEYGGGDPMDTLIDAGHDIDPFLSGTVMKSTGEGVVEITNPSLGTITLDLSDPKRPRRTSETGEVEEAGSNHEVWVDFGWRGQGEGDFFRPFNTIAAAAAAVADGGVIKIMPGWTTERPSIQNNKRMRLVAPLGGVTIGVR